MLEERLSIHERISILETEWTQIHEDIKDIKDKLDELLHLKSKGLGAFWVISLLLLMGSGIITFFSNLATIFPRHHS